MKKVFFICSILFALLTTTSCKEPCENGIQDEGEAGIDCGGECGDCPEWYSWYDNQQHDHLIGKWYLRTIRSQDDFDQQKLPSFYIIYNEADSTKWLEFKEEANDVELDRYELNGYFPVSYYYATDNDININGYQPILLNEDSLILRLSGGILPLVDYHFSKVMPRTRDSVTINWQVEVQPFDKIDSMNIWIKVDESLQQTIPLDSIDSVYTGSFTFHPDYDDFWPTDAAFRVQLKESMIQPEGEISYRMSMSDENGDLIIDNKWQTKCLDTACTSAPIFQEPSILLFFD